MARPKTQTNVCNQLTDREVTQRMHAGCPSCGRKLVPRNPIVTDDDTGRVRSGGFFIGCSGFGRGCDARYSLSIKKTGAEERYFDPNHVE